MNITYADGTQPTKSGAKLLEELQERQAERQKDIPFPLNARKTRRIRKANALRDQKKATRRYRRRLQAEADEQQNLLALARVSLGYVESTEAMKENVERHLGDVEEALADQLAAPKIATLGEKPDRPSAKYDAYMEGLDDALHEARLEAAKQINDRLRWAVENAHTDATAAAAELTENDTRGRTFVSVVRG